MNPSLQPSIDQESPQSRRDRGTVWLPLLAPFVLAGGCALGFVLGQDEPPVAAGMLTLAAWLDLVRAALTFLGAGFLLVFRQKQLGWTTWVGVAGIVAVLFFEVPLRFLSFAFSQGGYELWSQTLGRNLGFSSGDFSPRPGIRAQLWQLFVLSFSVVGVILGLFLQGIVRTRQKH